MSRGPPPLRDKALCSNPSPGRNTPDPQPPHSRPGDHRCGVFNWVSGAPRSACQKTDTDSSCRSVATLASLNVSGQTAKRSRCVALAIPCGDTAAPHEGNEKTTSFLSPCHHRHDISLKLWLVFPAISSPPGSRAEIYLGHLRGDSSARRVMKTPSEMKRGRSLTAS